MKNVYLQRLLLMLAMLHVCALSWAATGPNRALSEFDSGAAFAENVLIDPIDCSNGESYSNDATDGYADAPGFESWVFNHQGNAGNFIGNSASNGNSGPSGDINTGGQAWGLFANSGGTANQIRPLTNPLAEGDKISLAMDNGSIDDGGSVGFGLQNANGENLIEFYFAGGDDSYKFNAADGETSSEIGFTGAGLYLSFEVASGGNVNIEVTTLSDGNTYNFTRTLNNPVGGQAVRQVRFFNFNAGGGSDRDAFFNSLELCYALELDCNGDLGGSAFVDGCGTCVSGNTGALACLDLEIACPQPQPEVVSLTANCQGEVPDLTAEPFEAVLASPADFAGVQGEPWLYGMYAFGDFNGFELLPNWTGFVWNTPGTNLDFPQLDPNGGHPELDSPFRNPVRRWVSDVDGQVRVYGDFFDRNTSCGDGVNVRIYQNGVQFYEYLNVPGNSVTYSQTITVAAGDIIDFVIDRRFDADCDDTHFTNNIAVPLTQTQTPPAGSLIGENTVVTVTTSTTGGNTTSCEVEIDVVDNEAPTISAPAALTLSADAGECEATGVALGSATTADNCGVANVENDAPASFPVGTTTVTWTVTDVNGNSNTAEQAVTVEDNEAPTIAAPAGLTLSSDAGACEATGVALGSATTSDNCGVANVENNAPASFPVGTTTVTWTVTDVNENSNTAEQIVTVEDNEAPTISAPAGLTLSADAGACAATGVELGSATNADNCGVANVEHDAPTSFPVGTTTVTWTVTDVNGNSNTAEQIVTVEDNEAPTIAALAALTLSADAGECEATGVALGSASTDDNCGVATVENDAPSSFAVGTTTVTWTVTDVNGNTATAEQIVTVEDNEAPVVNTNNISIALSCAGIAEIEPSDIDAGSSDNCGIDFLTADVMTFGTEDLGDNVVTLTATDVNGNSSFNTAIVTILEAEEPDDNVVVTSDLTVNENGNILIFQNAPSSLELPASTTLSASLSSGDAIADIQWFVAELPDGEFEAIPGATDPTLIVQAQDDLHQEYKAVVTIDGCTISSSINLFSVNVSCGNGGNKVLICHVPPGNPSKMKNICVNFNAVDAILNNSDSFLGSCDFDDKSLEAENNSEETELTIYPNPNGGTFRVKYAGSSSQVIHVYDAQGRKVYSESLADQPANFNMEINLPVGAQGIYFVQILDEFSVIAQAKVAVLK